MFKKGVVMKKVILFLLNFMFIISLWAQEQSSVELTIYNQNFALVKDRRQFDLKKGINKIEFKDVAALVEPASVHFTSLYSPNGCVILEQNYEYDH
jgi:hypothetical protein